MLGPFTFTFTLESEEIEKFEKVAAAAAAADLYQTMITTRAPDGANKLVALNRFSRVQKFQCFFKIPAKTDLKLHWMQLFECSLESQ